MQYLKTAMSLSFLSVLQERLAKGGHQKIVYLRMFEDIAYCRARSVFFGEGQFRACNHKNTEPHWSTIETIYTYEICELFSKFLITMFMQICKHEVSHNSGNNILRKPSYITYCKKMFLLMIQWFFFWGWLRKTGPCESSSLVKSSGVAFLVTFGPQKPMEFHEAMLGRVRYPGWYIYLHLP